MPGAAAPLASNHLPVTSRELSRKRAPLDRPRGEVMRMDLMTFVDVVCASVLIDD